MSQTPDAGGTPPSQPNPTPPPVPPTAPPPPAGPAPVTTEQDFRNLAMVGHILNFTLIGSLVVYLIKKGQNAFLDTEAKEALNFSLTCLIAVVVLSILHFIPVIGWIAYLARPAITIAQIVLGIMGGMKARDGISYRYPVNLRLIK